MRRTWDYEAWPAGQDDADNGSMAARPLGQESEADLMLVFVDPPNLDELTGEKVSGPERPVARPILAHA